MSGTTDRATAGATDASPTVLEAFDAATRAIAGLQSVDDVLGVIVEQVRPLVGARYAALGIVDGGGRMERFITSGMDGETRSRIGHIPRGDGLLGLIVTENRSFRIADIATDPRRAGFPPNHPPMHSFLGVPVTVRGQSVGNLYLTEKIGATEFSEDDQRLVETFALHAGIAIENARLHEQLRGIAIVDERERISQDLHDSVIQRLYGVGLSLEDVPELVRSDPDEVERRVERAIDSLNVTIGDIRRFIFGLQPERLGGTTLADGIAAIVEDFRHHSLIDVELVVTGGDDEPDLVSAHLIGIVNEALSNVARHSGATRAVVRVRTVEGGDVHVVVSDNGHGFDPEPATRLGHQGLDNMRTRAVEIGATMEIASDGSGTRLEIRRLPGRRDDDAGGAA